MPDQFSSTRLSLPGRAIDIRLSESGCIFILIKDAHQKSQLLGYSLRGEPLFQRDLPDNSFGMQFASDEEVWAGTPNSLELFNSKGEHIRTIGQPAGENEQAGAFLPTPEGEFICALQALPGGEAKGRVLRMDAEGNTHWSLDLHPYDLAYGGVIQASRDTGWEIRPKPAWEARSWTTAYQQPLLLSGNCLIAAYEEMPGSGLGRIYGIEATTGRMRWSTKPRPYSNKAVAGHERFLIGSQGYGAFETWLYNASGEVLQHWPSHGYYLPLENGEIRVVEMENRVPSRSHFVIFKPEGTVIKGPHLPGYYTTYPFLDEQNNVIFWRERELMLIDKDLNKQVLCTDPSVPDSFFPSRLLRGQEGNFFFTAQGELWIFEQLPGKR